MISDARTSGILLLASTYWIEIGTAADCQKSRNIFKLVSVKKLKGLRRILPLPTVILELRPSQFRPANFACAGLWQFRNELFFFSIRRRHTILVSDWSSDVCSSDLLWKAAAPKAAQLPAAYLSAAWQSNP